MEAPRWFTAALAQEPEHVDLEVLGSGVHARVWGDRSHPGLVLVHGGLAHSGWWDHVAPQLARSHRVVALDLSGHGDSDWRPTYGMSTWAQEVMAVAEALIEGPPVVIGHSMGGWVALTAGVEHGERLAGVLVIDSPLFDQPPEEAEVAHRRQPTRVYADLEEAVARFRTAPPQDVLLPFVVRHVAEQSLRAVRGGWTWKFDPSFWGQRESIRDLLPHVSCRGAFFRCEHGLITPAMGEQIRHLLAERIPVIELPDTGHHPMLDRPLPLVAALRTLLAWWEEGV